MNIVYIHGLDSDANSTKGLLLEHYCQQYYPEFAVLRPDLNKSPAQVFKQLTDLIVELSQTSKTVLVGSSLGGYFSTLVSNRTGCPILLLNPSTQPHITLQRFSKQPILKDITGNKSLTNQVIHTTASGWSITDTDLQWLANNQLISVDYPNKVAVWIKDGDELLNPHVSADFYQQHGVDVILQTDGDHRFSDFEEHLPMVIKTLQQL